MTFCVLIAYVAYIRNILKLMNLIFSIFIVLLGLVRGRFLLSEIRIEIKGRRLAEPAILSHCDQLEISQHGGILGATVKIEGEALLVNSQQVPVYYQRDGEWQHVVSTQITLSPSTELRIGKPGQFVIYCGVISAPDGIEHMPKLIYGSSAWHTPTLMSNAAWLSYTPKISLNLTEMNLTIESSTVWLSSYGTAMISMTIALKN